MSENEMLNKKETLEEALGEEIEAVKGTVEEAAENAADKTLEDLEAEKRKTPPGIGTYEGKDCQRTHLRSCACVRADRWIFLLA